MAVKPASTFIPSRAPIADKDGMATWSFIKILQDWDTKLRNGLNSIGQITQDIPTATKILGRVAIGTILQFISDGGVVQPNGIVSATDAAQGAVQLPVGSVGNTLGSAAMRPTTAFDPSGAAAAAQSAAETFASAAAAAAQGNAESFASNASNLASGTVAIGLLPGISVTITTAKLTVGGTNGSMTFTNGILTGQVQAT